jgi:catechol 2,3-dioxygenase-like lactoylglutathione lyase family enzyme
LVLIDHIGVRVGDIGAASRFYDAVFKALGHSRCYAAPDLIGYGSDGQAFFWLHRSEAGMSGVHIAFAASDLQSVEAFHAAGLAARGSDNGAPGPRPDYGTSYFAAVLLDPAGNNVEAICNKEGA